jgi:hypothetical protein
MVYLINWFDWQRLQNTDNLWRYSKNNPEYQDFNNILVNIFRILLEIKIQQHPTFKKWNFMEFLNDDDFLVKLYHMKSAREWSFVYFLKVFQVNIRSRMWRNLIYQVVMPIFVYPLVQDVVEPPFYFTFVSVPFSQIVIFKIFRNVRLWISVESTRGIKIWIILKMKRSPEYCSGNKKKIILWIQEIRR